MLRVLVIINSLSLSLSLSVSDHIIRHIVCSIMSEEFQVYLMIMVTIVIATHKIMS